MFNTIYDILSLGLRRFTLMSHGENTLLRVTPTLTHYSDIVSGISSGSIYGINIYIYSDISFWPSIWHLFWRSIWHLF